jgi:hypothetical protein
MEILKEIENAGAEILPRSTCVDFFHLRGKTGIGHTSNILEILSSFNEATSVIRL